MEVYIDDLREAGSVIFAAVRMKSYRLMKQNDLDTFTIAIFDLMNVKVLKARFLSSKSGLVSNYPISRVISFQLST